MKFARRQAGRQETKEQKDVHGLDAAAADAGEGIREAVLSRVRIGRRIHPLDLI